MDLLTHLLVEAATGDEGALQQFVVTAQPDVWRFCAGTLGTARADDATQETFVRAWRAAGSFRAESSARTWLLAIARRVCFDAFRKEDRQARAYRHAEAPEPDQTGAVVLQELVAALAPDRRTAFVLTQVLGLPYQEAADILGCPIGTIRSRVARARADLQEMHREAPGDPAVGRSAAGN